MQSCASLAVSEESVLIHPHIHTLVWMQRVLTVCLKFFVHVATFVLVSILHVYGHIGKNLKYRRHLNCNCITYCTRITSFTQNFKD